jgi:uncharacterized protein (TIGR02246 family)
MRRCRKWDRRGCITPKKGKKMTTGIATEAGFGWTEADEAAVRAVPDRIRDAWGAHDAAAFAAAYTSDATMILSGDRYFQGRPSILQAIKHSFAGDHKGTTLLQNIVNFRVIGPQTAVLITDGGVLAPGETVPAHERELRATWVIAKENGEWLVAAYHNGRPAGEQLRGV